LQDFLNTPGALSPTKIQFTSPRPYERPSETQVSNVIIARNINQVNEQVQIQALELIRGKRIFSRREVHIAPKNLLVIALLLKGTAKLSPHLNNHMFISHVHMPDDPLQYVAAREAGFDDSDGSDRSDAGSMSSVIRTPPATPGERSQGRMNRSAALISQAVREQHNAA
jgi:hypothetical protein